MPNCYVHVQYLQHTFYKYRNVTQQSTNMGKMRWFTKHVSHTCHTSRIVRDSPGNRTVVPTSRKTRKCPGNRKYQKHVFLHVCIEEIHNPASWCIMLIPNSHTIGTPAVLLIELSYPLSHFYGPLITVIMTLVVLIGDRWDYKFEVI